MCDVACTVCCVYSTEVESVLLAAVSPLRDEFVDGVRARIVASLARYATAHCSLLLL